MKTRGIKKMLDKIVGDRWTKRGAPRPSRRLRVEPAQKGPEARRRRSASIRPAVRQRERIRG